MVFSVSTILSYTTANRVVERPEIPDSFRTQFPPAPEHPSTSDMKTRFPANFSTLKTFLEFE